jgi:hypothetical protein
MLDKLPLELLDHVLDLLPPPSSRRGARERTDTLLACCLDSKLVKERALPVLWRSVRFEKKTSVCNFTEALSHASNPSSAHTRNVVIKPERGERPLIFEEIVEIFRLLLTAQELYLEVRDAVDLAMLQQTLPGASSLK